MNYSYITSFLGSVEVLGVTDLPNTILNDMFDMAMMHLRIEEPSRTDQLLRDHIATGVAAAENYLQKDILPKSYELCWVRGDLMVITCGEIRNLKVATGDSPREDITASLKFTGSRRFRDAGLRIASQYQSTVLNPRYVSFDSGFLKAALVPPEVKSFTNAFIGMLGELRELANVGVSKYSVDEFPIYLLQSLKTEVIA